MAKEATTSDIKRDEKGNVERETYTAKQVATRIGTDAKTLRKFFRSPASTVEPVGQGGRYEFDKEDLPKIKAEFDKWNSSKVVRVRRAPGEKVEKVNHRQVVGEENDDLELPDDPELLDEEDEEIDLDEDFEEFFEDDEEED